VSIAGQRINEKVRAGDARQMLRQVTECCEYETVRFNAAGLGFAAKVSAGEII
jgi:hypothetical protein